MAERGKVRRVERTRSQGEREQIQKRGTGKEAVKKASSGEVSSTCWRSLLARVLGNCWKLIKAVMVSTLLGCWVPCNPLYQTSTQQHSSTWRGQEYKYRLAIGKTAKGLPNWQKSVACTHMVLLAESPRPLCWYQHYYLWRQSFDTKQTDEKIDRRHICHLMHTGLASGQTDRTAKQNASFSDWRKSK